MTITRKQFVLGLASTGLALATGCGSSGSGDAATSPTPVPSPTPSGNCAANGTTFTISGNHGHVIDVTSADIAAGVDKTYHIMGSATHDHTVTFTAADFAKLAMNLSAAEVSSVTGHSHNVTIVCA